MGVNFEMSRPRKTIHGSIVPEVLIGSLFFLTDQGHREEIKEGIIH